jgi:quercetin dioxygenase-like cupin family protein
MNLLIRRGDLPGAPNAGELVGAEHGGLPVSLILVEHRPGAGPRLHRHPYPELFVIHAGEAEFQIDDDHVVGTAGDILVAPAGAAHRFTNTGTEQLSLTAIHTAERFDTEWLEAGANGGAK